MPRYQRAQDSRRVASRAVRHGGTAGLRRGAGADFDQGSLQNFPIGTVAGTALLGAVAPEHVAAFLRALQRGAAGRGHQRPRGEVARRARAELTKETAAT